MVISRNTGSNATSWKVNWENYLKSFGTTVTLHKLVEVKDSMNRVTSSTETTTSILADIQWVTKKDLQHLNAGDVEIGDGMLFVEVDANIAVHDEITYNSKKWRVTSQIEGEQVAGELVYLGFIITANAQV